MSEQLNILQRIMKVKAAVPYVMKDSKVTGGGVRRDRIVGLLTDHCAAHGVLLITTAEQGCYIPTEEKSSKGTPLTIFSGRWTTYAVNPDAGVNPDGSYKEAVSATNPGQGNDHGDKAPGKARTYAEKMNLISIFMLETGTDEEERLPGEGGDTSETVAADPQDPRRAIETPKESPAAAARKKLRDDLATALIATQTVESKGDASPGLTKQINTAVEAKKLTKIVASALKQAGLPEDTFTKEVGAILWNWVGEQPEPEAAA